MARSFLEAAVIVLAVFVLAAIFIWAVANL
ncbi:nitrogen fixation-related uncharacterized protein [Amycolatopsis endophytica]|uniref:Nitrogen fixation-related uncharacterized protein n=1 Tax=Amycolatopsis endophytica TaxID=860233 RepID=A0A853BG01_9PSEU|nr:nitrogen fixation-related uncharacterized protein [Amycolatopsis endophytica]